MGREHTEKVHFKNINQLESKPQNNLCGVCFSITLVLCFGSRQTRQQGQGILMGESR